MTSLLSSLFVRPELFRKRQLVYLRNPADETDDSSRTALAHLREKIGSGPFQVLTIRDTPTSKAAPQVLTIGNLGSDEPLRDKDGDLSLCSYYLSSDPQ